MSRKIQIRLRKFAVILAGIAMMPGLGVRAGDFSFTNYVALAELAGKNGNLPSALIFYHSAEREASNNAANLCVLSRGYCDLTYLTNSAEVQKSLMSKALNCALQAIKADGSNATAHASAAVCYAKSCGLYDIKTQLAYSRLFKEEAERAIALNPKQDIAYYLLGRWNYGMANLGIISRTYVRVIYGAQPPANNEAAIQNLKKAVALAPDRLIYYSGLAMAYEATGEKALEKAALRQCCKLKAVAGEDVEAQEDARRRLAAMAR